VLSAGVLLCAASAQADERDQLKTIQADIAAKERAVRQQQQQRSSLLAQLKKQEEAISAAARQLRETQNTLTQLNKQIDEMNASIAKLERQRAAQERNLAAQLDAAFRQGEHTGVQLILSGEESQRGQRLQAYFGYLNQSRQETIAQLKQTREEVNTQKAELEEKQSQQQTLLYDQQAQQAKLEQARNERKKTLAGLESSIQQGQSQLSEMRANESRLRNSLARAEAAAKARAEREAREAQAVRNRQQEASRKGTTYKPTENERSLMSRTGGLGSPRGQAYWPVRGSILHRYGEQLQGELRWKGIVIGASEGSEVKARVRRSIHSRGWEDKFCFNFVVWFSPSSAHWRWRCRFTQVNSLSSLMTSVIVHTQKIRSWRCHPPSPSPCCRMRHTRTKWPPKLITAAMKC